MQAKVTKFAKLAAEVSSVECWFRVPSTPLFIIAVGQLDFGEEREKNSLS
jgi:hypothetical protein